MRVVALDRPGFGLSGRPDRGSFPENASPYSVTVQARLAGLHSLPGVRLFTWTIPAVINVNRVLTRVVTPGCQIAYMDRTGCHQCDVNRVF
jgi:hypothetical protein